MEAGESELALGAVVGPYRIEALLGEGGMGKVFRAVRKGEAEPVALNVMRSRLSGDEESRRRFLREARGARGAPPPPGAGPRRGRGRRPPLLGHALRAR